MMITHEQCKGGQNPNPASRNRPPAPCGSDVHPTRKPTFEQIKDAESQMATAYINRSGDCVYRKW